MPKYQLSRHAQQRCQQRGMRQGDLGIVFAHGTACEEGRIFLRKRDADERIRELKRDIQRLERMRGRTLVMKENCVVTVF